MGPGTCLSSIRISRWVAFTRIYRIDFDRFLGPDVFGKNSPLTEDLRRPTLTRIYRIDFDRFLGPDVFGLAEAYFDQNLSNLEPLVMPTPFEEGSHHHPAILAPNTSVCPLIRCHHVRTKKT
jgi:hypothetical protein